MVTTCFCNQNAKMKNKSNILGLEQNSKEKTFSKNDKPLKDINIIGTQVETMICIYHVFVFSQKRKTKSGCKIQFAKEETFFLTAQG